MQHCMLYLFKFSKTVAGMKMIDEEWGDGWMQYKTQMVCKVQERWIWLRGGRLQEFGIDDLKVLLGDNSIESMLELAERLAVNHSNLVRWWKHRKVENELCMNCQNEALDNITHYLHFTSNWTWSNLFCERLPPEIKKRNSLQESKVFKIMSRSRTVCIISNKTNICRIS